MCDRQPLHRPRIGAEIAEFIGAKLSRVTTVTPLFVRCNRGTKVLVEYPK